MDGGIRARALFVLEAPGPKAVRSGFVSRNNPDETAKNMLNLLAEAGFSRHETVLWNIVPWYIGDEKEIHSPKAMDIACGLEYLVQLTALLSILKAIVFVWKKAQRASKLISFVTPIRIFESYHPSPQFVNRRPGNRDRILESFRDVRANLTGR